MRSTKAWAKSLGISVEATPPAVEGYSKRYPRSARQVAVRAVILQGVVAVGCEVTPEPVIEWFRDRRIWRSVSPEEKSFLQNPRPKREERNKFRWHQEAEWALLWVIGKVESLGLPTRCCDTRRLVDEIIPALGSDIEPFIVSADLRPPSVLLAEDDRTYDLWCQLFATRRRRQPLPGDLNEAVLFERRYAFEWLDGNEKWDEVTCDA